MEILDHDGGPVVTTTPDLAARLAEAVDAPTRRRARAFEVALAVLAVVAAGVVLASGGAVSWWLVVAPLALAGILLGADLGRRRGVQRAIAAQERFAVRYAPSEQVVRFPLTGTEHPLDRFRRARVTGDVLVLERKDGTRTPVPVSAIASDQREALLADLGGR